MAPADLALAAALRVGELATRWDRPGLLRTLGVPDVFGWFGSLGSPGGDGDLPEPQNDPGEVRRKADEILSRPEYREHKTILQRIQDAISDVLADLLRNIGFGSSGAASVLAWIVLAMLGALVGLLVYWLVRSVIGDQWGAGRGHAEGEPVILEVDVHRTPAEWLARAEAHEAEGRWREGLLCRYRSLVTRLVELDVIAEAVGRTAGEYVGDVAQRHPAGSAQFRAATDLFESAWYGGVDTRPEGRDRFVGLADAVLAGAAAAARRDPPAPAPAPAGVGAAGGSGGAPGAGA